MAAAEEASLLGLLLYSLLHLNESLAEASRYIE